MLRRSNVLFGLLASSIALANVPASADPASGVGKTPPATGPVGAPKGGDRATDAPKGGSGDAGAGGATQTTVPQAGASQADEMQTANSYAARDADARQARMRARDQARRDDRAAYRAAHIAALHAGLLLTAAQQPLWPPVEAALRDVQSAREALRHGQPREIDGPAPRDAPQSDMHAQNDRDSQENMRASDTSSRLKQLGVRMVAVGQAIGKLADATQPLLAALTPQQKERIPVLLDGVGPRRLVQAAFGLDDSQMQYRVLLERGADNSAGQRGERGADRMPRDPMNGDRMNGDRMNSMGRARGGDGARRSDRDGAERSGDAGE